MPSLRSFRVLVIDDHPLLPVANDIRGALGSTGEPPRQGAGASVARSSKLLPDLAENGKTARQDDPQL